MSIDKNWALNQLRHARNSYVLSLAGLRLLNSPMLDSLRGRQVLIKPDGLIFDPDSGDHTGKRFEFLFDQVISSRDTSRADFDYDLETNHKFARRALVKESFEYAKAYANANAKQSAFKAMPWFDFCRLIRNALSHDFHFRFNAADKTLLPISWDGRTIDGSMDGQELKLLDPHLAVELAGLLEDFVRTN